MAIILRISEVRISCRNKGRNVVKKCQIWHCSPNFALKCRNVPTMRTLFWQEIRTSEFHKMIATCFIGPNFAL